MENKIPKVIHYCWFGRGEKPKLAKKCIKSWKKYLPDYEIKEWNEDNFDINSNQYVKEAYEAKKYAFVSDYVRFYALYNYGGIYMDTDVEVLRSLDCFLYNKAFIGFENDKYVAPGLILGAEKHNPIIKKMYESYSNKRFLLDDGTYNLTTVVEYVTDILKQHGLICNNTIQELDSIKVYSKTYFCPLTYNSIQKDFSDDTYTIHHFAASWHTKAQRKEIKRRKRYLERKEFLCRYMSERRADIVLDFKWILRNKFKILFKFKNRIIE